MPGSAADRTKLSDTGHRDEIVSGKTKRKPALPGEIVFLWVDGSEFVLPIGLPIAAVRNHF